MKKIKVSVTKPKLTEVARYMPLPEAHEAFAKSFKVSRGDAGNDDTLLDDFLNIMNQVALYERGFSLQDVFTFNNRVYERDSVDLARLFDTYIDKMTKLGKIKTLDGSKQVYDHEIFQII